MTHYQKFFLIEGIVSHVYNLKSSLKFNYYWHFGGNIIDQKCSYEKVTKNWAGSSPPSFGKIHKNSNFLCETFP